MARSRCTWAPSCSCGSVRCSTRLPCSPRLVALVGVNTALFAYLAGSVQTDIKSALSFASLSQVGIIVTEIGLGFRYVALVHILGHACLRTLQFVRAPTLLHDYHTMENAIGGHLPRGEATWARSAHPFRDWLYRLALERGYLDALLRDYVATPFVQVFRWFDAIERRWTDFLTGETSRESDATQAPLRDDRGVLMTFLEVPWLDGSIAVALVGSLWVSRVRDPSRAARLGLVFTGVVFVCSFLAWLAYYVGVDADLISRASLQPYLFGREVLVLDELSAPLVPTLALLHFLTALATARVKMRRFSFSWSLASEAIRLALFSCRASWLLVGLLSLCAVPPYFELRNRGRPTRVYVLHMALFVGLMVIGWAGVTASGPSVPPTWATVLLMAAILVRCGTVPAHCWVTDWFEHTSFGIALSVRDSAGRRLCRSPAGAADRT